MGSAQFRFLGDLTDEEKIVAKIRGQDRALILELLAELPGGQLSGKKIY